MTNSKTFLATLIIARYTFFLIYIWRFFFDNLFHSSNLQLELLEPAVKGTLNVLKASLDAKVKRVVFVSSILAVMMNPSWEKGRIMDETCWSDKDYCRTTKVDKWTIL